MVIQIQGGKKQTFLAWLNNVDSCSDADNCNIDEYQESNHNTEFGVSYNENAI